MRQAGCVIDVASTWVTPLLCRCASPIRTAVLGGAVLMYAAASTGAGPQPVDPAATIIKGTILTMDKADQIMEAVAVDRRGVILGVGKASAIVSRFRGNQTLVQSLGANEVLMPGFIDPHAHLIPWLVYNAVPVLSPCFPPPYASANPPKCSNYIASSLRALKPRDCSASAGIVFGNALDPSRQPYDETTSAEAFRKYPAHYLDLNVCPNRPVMVIDQSGHLAYVNRAAFDGLQAFRSRRGLSWPPQLPSGAAWSPSPTPAAGDNSRYSGLLIEEGGFQPFLDWLGATDRGLTGTSLVEPAKLMLSLPRAIREGINGLRDAGITTVVSIADSSAEARGIIAVANLKGSPIRTLINARPPALAKMPRGLGGVPRTASCDPRTVSGCALPMNLGVTGVKLTIDGSTQACTAAMLPAAPYASSGPCAHDASGDENMLGHFNYASAADVAAELKPYWAGGQWRFELHTNGPGATKMALDAVAQLQVQHPISRTVTLVHATVGTAEQWQQIADMRRGSFLLNGKAVAPMDIRVSHLTGHVPYWGGALEAILGADLARSVDPIASRDIPLGIPFTLHSDATVSPPQPLWFVRQAVTREAWRYPEMLDSEKRILGPENAISVRDALRAITISSAQEKEIDGWLGSIETGKVADFVVLSDNPLNYEPGMGGDPTRISDIKVVGTYINGKPTLAVKSILSSPADRRRR